MKRTRPIIPLLKKGLTTLFMFMLFNVFIYAQSIGASITGIIQNENNNPLAGALIRVSNPNGVNLHTTSDKEGTFILENVLPYEAYTITISKDAYENKTLTNYKIDEGYKVSLVVDMKNIKPSDALQQGSPMSKSFDNSAIPSSDTANKSKGLDEIVVTAMGVQRKSKSLDYATQRVKGDDLTVVPESNLLNSLNGKVAGLQINRGASGAGASVKVVLRGNKSTRDNGPLYVIDGLPINNVQSDAGVDIWGGRDGGDILSSINPDDIENINILKGASAAALYGSQAANGAIMITTKKGKSGKMAIDYSTSINFETPFKPAELQFAYGQTEPDSKYSWGAKGSFNNHVKNFFQTGINYTNNISVSGGNEKFQTYFSYSNTFAKGIMPTNEFNKHTFSFKESAQVTDRLKIEATVNLTSQEILNPLAVGFYNNALTGLYLFPRGLDFNGYKNNYEVLSTQRDVNTQNWWNINTDKNATGDDNQQNPYWILNRVPSTLNRERLYAAINLQYKLMDGLSFQARGNLDRSQDKFEQKSYASTQGTLADKNGRYQLENLNNKLYYGDLLLNFNKTLSNITITALLGTSMNYTLTGDKQSFDSKGADLQFANIFTIQAMKQGSIIMSQSANKKALVATFGSLNLDYKNYLILSVTGRNDWSSSLPGKSFFYPSIGLTAILSEIISMPTYIDFLKFRTSFAQVGNDIPAYANNPLNSISSINGLVQNTIGPKPGTTLQPEKSQSLEIGLEVKLFKGKVNLDATWYNNNTYNQYMLINAPSGTGFTKYAINAGNIQNTGYEIILGITALKTPKFKWELSMNISQNTNLIVALSDALTTKTIILTEPGVNNYAFYLKEGSAFGDIYGKVFARDAQNRIILDKDGKPTSKTDLEKVGNANPTALFGYKNSFSYQSFTLNFLIDARIGGRVMSMTQATMTEYGVSKETADARDNGGVSGNFVDKDGVFVSKINAQTYYSAVGGRAGITEAATYDATNIRLRELSLNYRLPQNIVDATKIFKSISVGFIARNLFFIYNNAPFDPEVTMNPAVGLQGVDVFGTPSTSSYGVSLKVNL